MMRQEKARLALSGTLQSLSCYLNESKLTKNNNFTVTKREIIIIIIMIMMMMMMMIPIVIGALGSISKGAKTRFGKLDVPDFLGSVQSSAILGTAHLLRKALCP